MDGIIEHGLVLHRSSEMLIVLRQLTASLKSLDYLGVPLAAAYVDMAIHKVVEEMEEEPSILDICLTRDLDFSALDQMIDRVFPVMV